RVPAAFPTRRSSELAAQMEAVTKQAEARVASEAERAEQAERRVTSESERAEQAERARENLRTEVDALQAQLKEREQHLQASDSSDRKSTRLNSSHQI